MTLNINQWTNGCRTVARTPPVGRASLADERDASPGSVRQLAVMHRHHRRWWCWWYCMSTDSLRLRLTPPAAPLNHKAIITPPPVGNAALWRACLSVCLSANTSPESHVQPSPNFLRMLPVVMDRSFSVGVQICYVLPVFWTTSNFAVTVFTGHVYPVAAISLRVMCRLTPLLLGADGVLS